MNLRKSITIGLLFLGSILGVAKAAQKPNILWITSEDNGVSWISCYGGKNTKTPAIDQLAKEGFRYLYCFDNAAVCAPTRSCWITGMYGISNGTQPMPSRNEIPHDKIPYYPDLLKKAGYHTSNPGKTDYNIGAEMTMQLGTWGNREAGKSASLMVGRPEKRGSRFSVSTIPLRVTRVRRTALRIS